MSTFNEPFIRPPSDFYTFKVTLDSAVSNFLSENVVYKMLEERSFTMEHYHRLLVGIFHQVYFSSASFALAGSMIGDQNQALRNYLFHHAEEEKTHWIWILEDLKSTGFKGSDPRSIYPNWASRAYLSYGIQLGLQIPAGRLAMAAVLEEISGKFAPILGKKAVDLLGINKEQAKFFLIHGELDQGHSVDILDVLKESDISPTLWGNFNNIASVTSQMYKNIYNVSMSTKSTTD